MRQIGKRLTYANVMSSLAVFLVLGGATAFAAGHLGRNSVGSKQLKKNAVTAAKLKKRAVTGSKLAPNSVTGQSVKSGSLTGTDINVATLPAVPNAASASNAATANSLNGRIPFSAFTGPGDKVLATVGPFTVLGHCVINEGGTDRAELQLTTAVNGAAMDDNNGDEFTLFNVEDNPAELIRAEENTGEPEIETEFDGDFLAVAPDGTTIASENHGIGLNIAGHPGQCFFAGTIAKLH